MNKRTNAYGVQLSIGGGWSPDFRVQEPREARPRHRVGLLLLEVLVQRVRILPIDVNCVL